MLDVCLIAEGGYPYAAGAVAAWVASLIDGLGDLRFGIVHIGPGRDLPREASFGIPPNLERLVDVFPYEPDLEPGRSTRRGTAPDARARAAAFSALGDFLGALLEGRLDGSAAALEVAGGGGPAALSVNDMVGSQEAWVLFERLYAAAGTEAPLLGSYRIWRSVLGPVLRALRPRVPEARVYHAISAGHAGILAALAAGRAGASLLVTEPADPAEDRAAVGLDRATQDALRAALRRIVFERASRIVTFTETALRAEVARGAPVDRCCVIADGIDVDAFTDLRARGKATSAKETVLVALVAPVLPEKDVKTFLRAAKLLIEGLDLVEVVVVGRTDLNLAYHRECLLQAQMLGIDRMVRFTGAGDMRALLETLDCLVLTSASEGAPLVLLEAMAAGVPVVATDTGGCRELLEGRSAEDRALGPAGIVCPIGDHERIAAGVMRCIRDAATREGLVAAGRARAERFYRRERVHAAYRELYAALAETGATARARAGGAS